MRKDKSPRSKRRKVKKKQSTESFFIKILGKPSAISQITYYTNNPQFPLLLYLFSPLFPIPTETTAYFAPRYLSDAEKSPELFFCRAEPKKTEKRYKKNQTKIAILNWPKSGFCQLRTRASPHAVISGQDRSAKTEKLKKPCV